MKQAKGSFIEPLKTQLRSEGYRVSDTPYENIRQKIDVICPKGHKLSMMWQNLKRGRRCKYCRWEEKKISFDIIQKGFVAEGYRVIEEGLDKTTIQATTILKVLCPEGHLCGS